MSRVWLWFTVLFANFAEAIAEGRGKAQADTLRRPAPRRSRTSGVPTAPSSTGCRRQLARRRRRAWSAAGEVIPGDGEIIEGIASVDESAITGESAPVIRESGGDRSAVTGGTRVLSDQIVVRITSKPGETFLDRMIALVEGADRQKTPERDRAQHPARRPHDHLPAGAVVTLQPFAIYSGAEQKIVVLVALLVCLIPTTIGALLSAIGIAGMDRLVQRNVLAMSGRAVEAAGDVLDAAARQDRHDHLRQPAGGGVPSRWPGSTERDWPRPRCCRRLADETPEGRSIVELAHESTGSHDGRARGRRAGAVHRPDPDVGRRLRRPVASARARPTRCGAGSPSRAARCPPTSTRSSSGIATRGRDPAGGRRGRARVLGVIQLKDIVKPGMRERFDELRAMGIRTVMITGDNPLTAAAIAAEAGVDDFLAEATPEDKMDLHPAPSRPAATSSP